jgi:TnsA-like endonuclease N terminal
VGAAVADADCGFEVEYRLAGGSPCRAGLAGCVGVPLEDASAVRGFRFGKGVRSFAGWWWLASTGRHVGYESFTERDQLMLLDFDPDVTGVAAQPLCLCWRDESGRARRHVPDFFARLRDGRGVVIDVRPDDRIPERDAEVFAVTARACALAGWGFRRVGEADRVLAANVRWLSRYRHPRCSDGEVAVGLMEAFAAGAPLFDGAASAGDRLRVLPVLFHLMWRGGLEADLAGGPLGPGTVVRASARAASW